MPDVIGPCLVYAIYHSPLAFIRTLLEIGADPNAPVDDGFPPLIAALCCTRQTPGANTRTDVAEIIQLLLAFGTNPNQRGINDYTPLHMAVAERNAAAVRLLLDGGADSQLRTRIDNYETPLEMANSIKSTGDRGDAPLDILSYDHIRFENELDGIELCILRIAKPLYLRTSIECSSF